MTARVLTIMLVVLSSVGCADTEAVPSADRCSALLDHEVELRLAQVDGASDDELTAHRRALSAGRAEYIAHCEENFTASQVRCALEARTLDNLQDCE